VWEISATTKDHIAEGAYAQSQQSVLVFRLVNFHRQQLELGAHASRQLTQRVTRQIKEAVGPDAIVSNQRNGTIVALLPGDRDAAERTAHQLVHRFETSPMTSGGRGASTVVRLACGIIAFPQAGPPLTSSITVPMLEPDFAASVPG
jgi:hypothetical protein